MRPGKAYISTFKGLQNWKHRYYFSISVLMTVLRLWRFNIKTNLGNSPQGYDPRKDGAVISYWVLKYDIEPESIMVVVSDSRMLAEMTPDILFRDTPKHQDDSISFVVDVKRLKSAIHVGKNKAWFLPQSIKDQANEAVTDHFAHENILLGIREGLKVIYHGHTKQQLTSRKII